MSPPKLTISKEYHCVVSPSQYHSYILPGVLRRAQMFIIICSITFGPLLASRGNFKTKSVQAIFLLNNACRQAIQNETNIQPNKKVSQAHQRPNNTSCI